MTADYSRCRVVYPGGVIPQGRLLFHAGRAAVWVEDRRARKAERVLFATDAEFVKPITARTPIKIVTPTEQWDILSVGGGCGCGSQLKSFTMDELLSDELTHIG